MSTIPGRHIEEHRLMPYARRHADGGRRRGRIDPTTMRGAIVLAFLGIGGVATSGCGSKAPPEEPPLAIADVRAALTRVAADGMVDSEVLALAAPIEELRGTDAALADSLRQQLDLLIAAGTRPEGPQTVRVRALAADMLKQLPRP